MGHLYYETYFPKFHSSPPPPPESYFFPHDPKNFPGRGKCLPGGVDFFQENNEYSLKQDSHSFSEAILFLFITFIMTHIFQNSISPPLLSEIIFFPHNPKNIPGRGKCLPG